MAMHDPVPDLMQLGYTPREAAFLYLAGASSGFFLARQYARFAQRRPGALIQQLIEKGQAYGHLIALDCGQRRHVYHLCSRTIYRLIGDEESQNRRVKGDQEIKTKLMVLDYVLDHLGKRFLCSTREKVSFFQDTMDLSKGSLLLANSPGLLDPRPAVDRLFQDRFPILISKTDDPKRPNLTFTYFDHGTCTIKPFVRQLRVYQPLFDELCEFQLEYVALSSRNFEAAEQAFCRLFSSDGETTDLLPLGRDHFIRFIEAQDLFERNDRRFSHADLVVLREGEEVYRRPEHDYLYKVWRRNTKEFAAELLKLCGIRLTQGRLSLHLLHESYPVVGHRYQGRPIGKVLEAQLDTISGLRSSAS
jgi:hypothetical protein